MTQRSTEVITHKLIIKWIGTRYIWKKFAENIFNQLNNPEQKVIIISNTETLTYFQKYKTDVELLLLDNETKDIEYLLYISNLSESKKDEIREVIENRRRERKSINGTIVQEIIKSKKL